MNLANYLDLYHNHLSETRAIELNFPIWNILGQYVWPNKYIGGTYENEFNYLKVDLRQGGLVRRCYINYKKSDSIN